MSELGYGAWGIGKTAWLGADDDESLRALRRAIEQGVNFLDTALLYGDGHSEQLVGRAVRDSQGTVHVASKIPPKNMKLPAPWGFRPTRLSRRTGWWSAPSVALPTSGWRP